MLIVDISTVVLLRLSSRVLISRASFSQTEVFVYSECKCQSLSLNALQRLSSFISKVSLKRSNPSIRCWCFKIAPAICTVSFNGGYSPTVKLVLKHFSAGKPFYVTSHVIELSSQSDLDKIISLIFFSLFFIFSLFPQKGNCIILHCANTHTHQFYFQSCQYPAHLMSLA